MALFKINNSAVKKLVARDFDLERNLQELFEVNLKEILNIVFLLMNTQPVLAAELTRLA